jgi:hypothetical protein
MQSPVSFFPDTFVADTEGGLIAAADGIHLMTFPAAVEINLSVCFVIPVVNGHTVGVTVIANQGKDTPGLLFQKVDAFLPRKFLFDPGQFTKHEKYLPFFVFSIIPQKHKKARKSPVFSHRALVKSEDYIRGR